MSSTLIEIITQLEKCINKYKLLDELLEQQYSIDMCDSEWCENEQILRSNLEQEVFKILELEYPILNEGK